MRVWPILVIAMFLTACMGMEESPSAVDFARADGPQTRHYRPVHAAHPDWRIAVTGRSAVLRAQNHAFKLSYRAPQTVVVRAAGTVVGSVEKTSDGAAFRPLDDKETAAALRCTPTGVQVLYGQQQIDVRWDANGAATEKTSIRAGSGAHRYAITMGTDVAVEVRSPMNDLGVLLLQIDEVPLAQRAGMAWLVTHVDVCKDYKAPEVQPPVPPEPNHDPMDDVEDWRRRGIEIL